MGNSSHFIKRFFVSFIGVVFGVLALASVAFAGTTPAISTATGKAGAGLRAVVVEFNAPVWTDAALTTGLGTADFAYTNGNSAGAASISAVTHTAGDDFAIITVNADLVAGDIDSSATADKINAAANAIFTVGGALSQKTTALGADGGAPSISSVTFLSTGTGKDRLLVTFSERVWSDAAASPPTPAVAVADFAITNGNAGGCATATPAASLLSVAGAKRVVLHCAEATVAGDTADSLNAASGTAIYDAFGNAMSGTGGPVFTQDTTAPAFSTGIEAVKDGTQALVYFSEPVFTDEPAANTNPGVIATGDVTYTDGSSTAGGTGQNALTPGGSSRWMLTSLTKFYGLMTITGAATTVADLSGSAADDTLDAASSTSIYDATGTAMATGGTVANRTLTDTTDPVILSITFANSSNKNTLAFAYSEDVTITGAPAAGASQASTTSIGDLTTAGTVAGFGAFATTGDVTYNSLFNVVALNGAGTTFTLTMAGQSTGIKVSGSTEPSGTFTPTIPVVDLAPTPNAMETTSIQSTLAGSGSWDVTAPIAAENLRIQGSSASNVNLAWQAPVVASDFAYYIVFYRASTPGVTIANGTPFTANTDGNLLIETTGSTNVTGLTTGLVYYFTVAKVDIEGNASLSNEVNVATSSASTIDSTPPPAPTSFAVSIVGGKPVLTWVDPTATDLASIHILRGKNGSPISGLAFATVLKGIKTYTDADMIVGDKADYMLRAADTSNNLSTLTAVVSITVTAAATSPAPAPAPAEPAVAPPAEEPAQVEEPAPAVLSDEAQALIVKYQKSIEKYQEKLDKLNNKKKKNKKTKALIKKYKKYISNYEKKIGKIESGE